MISVQRIMAFRPKLGERGIAAVEMALIAPVFVGMLYGFFDFTKWSYVRAATSGALEQVARSAGVGGPAVDPRVFETPGRTLVRKVSGTATFVWRRRAITSLAVLASRRSLPATRTRTEGTTPVTVSRTLLPMEHMTHRRERLVSVAPMTSFITRLRLVIRP